MMKTLREYQLVILFLMLLLFFVFTMTYPVYKRFENKNITVVDYSESFFNNRPVLNLEQFDINADFDKETQTLNIKNIPSESLSNIRLNKDIFYYYSQCNNDFCDLHVELRRN